ncbi:MAG: type II secretion system protein [Patescibacteria group bacterium]
MNSKKTSAVTLVEIMIVVAILGLLAAIAIPNFMMSRDASLRAREEEKRVYLEVGSDNRERIQFSGSETGIVNRILELPNTPMNQPFPIVEIMVTNNSGHTYLRSSFPQNPEKLAKGDAVLVTTIRHSDIGGSKPIHFVTKLHQ